MKPRPDIQIVKARPQDLERAFFPHFQTADLDGKASAKYPILLPSAVDMTLEEVESGRSKPDNAPEISRIANRGFRLVLEVFPPLVTHLFQACINLGHHPREF